MLKKIRKFLAKDKRLTSRILNKKKKIYCPPHYFPHSIPIIQKKTFNKPCHVHKRKWEQYTHHLPYCILTNCPHRKLMKKAYKKISN